MNFIGGTEGPKFSLGSRGDLCPLEPPKVIVLSAILFLSCVQTDRQTESHTHRRLSHATVVGVSSDLHRMCAATKRLRLWHLCCSISVGMSDVVGPYGLDKK